MSFYMQLKLNLEGKHREFKDGMFRTLFNDKEKMLELYNAVSDEALGK